MPDRDDLSVAPSSAKGGWTPGPWFAGPLQPEDEYGGPGGVSVGPYDIAAKFSGRPDYDPARFNDHYEDQIALVSGCNHDAEANAHLIAAAPALAEVSELAAALGDVVRESYTGAAGEDRLRLSDGTVLTGEVAKAMHALCRSIIGLSDQARAALSQALGEQPEGRG